MTTTIAQERHKSAYLMSKNNDSVRIARPACASEPFILLISLQLFM